MSVLQFFLTIIGIVVAILIGIMIYLWAYTQPIIRQLRKSAHKQICPDHGQFLHVCTQCKH